VNILKWKHRLGGFMKTKIITKDTFKTSLWSGGTTTELYIYPENSIYKNKDFWFRLSSATVELEKSTFTPLEGIKRYIAPINGSLKLFHNDRSLILEPTSVTPLMVVLKPLVKAKSQILISCFLRMFLAALKVTF